MRKDLRAEVGDPGEDETATKLLERIYEFARCNLYGRFKETETETFYDSFRESFADFGIAIPHANTIDDW